MYERPRSVQGDRQLDGAGAPHGRCARPREPAPGGCSSKSRVDGHVLTAPFTLEVRMRGGRSWRSAGSSGRLAGGRRPRRAVRPRPPPMRSPPHPRWWTDGSSLRLPGHGSYVPAIVALDPRRRRLVRSSSRVAAVAVAELAPAPRARRADRRRSSRQAGSRHGHLRCPVPACWGSRASSRTSTGRPVWAGTGSDASSVPSTATRCRSSPRSPCSSRRSPQQRGTPSRGCGGWSLCCTVRGPCSPSRPGFPAAAARVHPCGSAFAGNGALGARGPPFRSPGSLGGGRRRERRREGDRQR